MIPNDGVLRPPAPRRLVFAGEAIVDVVLRVPALPPRGGDLLATSSVVTAGGGFNVMAAAARQGLPVLYAGGHGSGPWGDVIRSALAAEGIVVLRAADPDRDTGFDVALVEPDAERTFVTHLGAETVRGPGAWDAVPAGPGDAVYVSGYGLVAPDSGPVLGAWAAALPSGVLLFLDPGPLAAQIPGAVLGPVLDRCDWLSCNAREARVLAGAGAAAAPGETARRLLGRTGGGGGGPVGDGGGRSDGGAGRGDGGAGPVGGGGPVGGAGLVGGRGVIVRTGAGGCHVAVRSGGVTRVPAPVVTAVDTTGAGDAHSGVFLAALAEGLAPLDAAARANAAAAWAVTRHGPATAPTRAELDAWWPG